MKILITGAAGFIGSNVAQFLHLAGHNIFGVDNYNNQYDPLIKFRNARELKKLGIKVLEGDLRGSELFHGLPNDFDIIIHFAAQPGISSETKFNEYFENNFLAAQNTSVFAELNKGLKLFIYISTSSVYGLYATKTEEQAPEPASYYGVTKLAGEQLILERNRNRKFPSCSLRLFSVYGPRERPEKLCYKLIDCALNNKPFTLFRGSLDHKRSFTFVDDISIGIQKTIEHCDSVQGEIINLGTEIEHKTSHVIQTVEELTGKRIAIELVPPRMGDQQETKAITEKANKLLGYLPITSLKTGLTRQLEWYREVVRELI